MAILWYFGLNLHLKSIKMVAQKTACRGHSAPIFRTSMGYISTSEDFHASLKIEGQAEK